MHGKSTGIRSKRSGYLVNKAFSTFLLSTILSSVSVSLAVTVDSVIVGNLLGAEALAAVSLITPIAQMLSAFTALICVGGAMVASVFIGKEESARAGRILSASVVLSLIVGAALMLTELFALDAISGALTQNESLRSLVEEYLRVMLLSAPIYILLPGLSAFLRTDNAAKRASVALIAGNVCNLVLDIVFIRVCNMGIMGSSLATTVGYMLGFAIELLHFRSKTRSLAFRAPELAFTGRILKAGAPIALASALMFVRVYLTNSFVQRFLDAGAMQIMAVCFNLLMLASMFIGGVSQAFQPLGGILTGLGDNRGLRLCAARAWKTLLLCLALLLGVILLLPGLLLRLFGVEATEMAITAVRLFALCIPFYGINYLLMVTHQTMGRNKLSMLNACLDSLVVIVMLYVAGKLTPTLFWLGFAAGEALVSVTVILCSVIARSKHKELSPILLLPEIRNDVADFSARCDMQDLEGAMESIADFLRAEGIEKSRERIQLCLEELLTVYKKPDASHRKPPYTDIRLHKEGDGLVLCVLSAGARFDPVGSETDDLSLKLCNGMCKEIRYSYIAGENVVTFTFE